MRSLMTRRLMIRRAVTGRDRGVAAVVFALAAPMIIGAVGLSVDSGNLVLQRANVQKAADTAALAIGQDCALRTARCTNPGALATAQLMSDANAPGATPSIPGGVTAAAGTATIRGAKSVPMRFAATLGVQPQTVTASATVTWNQTPTAGRTYPVSLDICNYSDWASSSAVQKKTRMLYRYDYQPNEKTSHTRPSNCPDNAGGSHTSIGKALWVLNHPHTGSEFDSGSCLVATSAGNAVPGDRIKPDNPNFPSSCAADGRLAVNTTYLVMIGESSGWGGFGNAEPPKVLGYAPFFLTGWRNGGKNGPISVSNPPPAACTSKCRGIEGYFTGSVTSLDGVVSYGPDPHANFGSVRVKITG